MGRPAHMPYKDITPPRNWRHKKFECSKIHIWSWWRSRRSMTRGKRIPRIPTKERSNMPPSMQYDSSHSAVPIAWWLKMEGCHPYWYVFTNQKRPTGVIEKYDSRLISSSIHIYLPPLFPPTITDSMKTRPVLTRTQSKSIKILIFLFTPIFFLNPCFFLTVKILNVWFKKRR